MVPNDSAAAQGRGVNGVTDGYIQMFLLKFVCPQVPTPAFAALLLHTGALSMLLCRRARQHARRLIIRL